MFNIGDLVVLKDDEENKSHTEYLGKVGEVTDFQHTLGKSRNQIVRVNWEVLNWVDLRASRFRLANS
jgi:hypothetical protein